MLALFAKAKGTSPPDINAELSKNPKLWGLIRQLIRDKSKQLLEYAKQAVEIAIEQGEDAALAWLKEKLGESNVGE